MLWFHSFKSPINHYDKKQNFKRLAKVTRNLNQKNHPWTFSDHNLTHIYHQILEMTNYLSNKLWNLQHSKMSKLFWNCNLESKQMWSRHKRRYCRSYNKTKELFQYSLNIKSFVTSPDCQNDVRETGRHRYDIKQIFAPVKYCTSKMDAWFFAIWIPFLCESNR